jgi:hypothetical protein
MVRKQNRGFMNRDEFEKKQKKDISHKEIHHLSSEENADEIVTRKEMVHEDQDPIYPLDAGQGEISKNRGHKERKRKAS